MSAQPSVGAPNGGAWSTERRTAAARSVFSIYFIDPTRDLRTPVRSAST